MLAGRWQFFAMLLGSGASVLVSVGAYTLFTSAYEVPGPLFPAPTAEIWLDMANLVSKLCCHLHSASTVISTAFLLCILC